MPALPTNLFLDSDKLVLTETQGVPGSTLPGKIGILIRNPVHRRLVETAAIQLSGIPTILSGDANDPAVLAAFEMIIVDESNGSRIQACLPKHQGSGNGIRPAVIAVFPRQSNKLAESDQIGQSFEGILRLPQAPAPLASQLGLMLYSHRAYTQRFRSAIEEIYLDRHIFRSLTNGICVADALLPDQPLTYVNPAFEVMTGYSLEECRGRNCRFLQGDERDQPGLTRIRDALSNRKEITALVRNYKKDGAPFWNEVTISPIRGREGEVTHYVGVQSDVTARVECEATVRQSEKLAAVGKLASSIAHEINNPLESIMNLVYIAARTECSNETKDYLAQVDLELRRVKLITSSSLRFYKQSTNAQAMHCSELLNSVLGLYEARLLNSQIVVERDFRPATPLMCMETEICQVLNNLISNAIDAMHGSGGRLLLRLRETYSSGERGPGVRFTVADTGSGMNPETTKLIYKAFFTTKGIGGTGLGLWISSEIVERHRGTLSVRSRHYGAKAGTVFTLFLPHARPSR